MDIRNSRKRSNSQVVYSFALLLAVLFAATQTVPLVAQSQGATQPVSIKNFGKVNDNYYRGAQPKGAQYQDLKQLGIKTVIDLRNDSLEEAPEWARATGLQYVNIPLSTKRPATDEQTVQFLKLVTDPANWPVFVHCKGGRHRTGEMTAIYRITKDGWTGDQAYAEMKKYDFEDSFFYPRSLKKYVFSYYQRHAANGHGTQQR